MEQLQIYDAVMTALMEGKQLLAFIDSKAGQGKTFVLQTIVDRLCSMDLIFLPTAISAFAAQCYEGGRTTHSTFKVLTSLPVPNPVSCNSQVPINDNSELLVSPIQANNPHGQLLREVAVIIWDEAPMANRAILACIEETCQKVMCNDSPFRGKIILLVGDFCQTCPVIRGASK